MGVKKSTAIFLAILIAFSLLTFGGCGWLTETIDETEAEVSSEMSESSDEEEEEEEKEEDESPIIGLAYNIPKDFEMSSEESTATEQYFYTKDYLSGKSSDPTCILVTHEYNADFITPEDSEGRFDDITEDYIAQSYENEFDGVKVKKFELVELSGFEALHYVVTAKVSGRDLTVNAYNVYVGNDFMAYMFMEFGNSGYDDEFESSAEKMEPIRENEVGLINGTESEVADLEYSVPKGFEYSEDISKDNFDVYTAKKSSNINVVERSTSNGFEDITKEYMEEKSQREISSFKEIKIAGFDAYRIAYEPDVGGDSGERLQVQYIVNADGDVYIYTLTQVGDDDYVDAFDEMVENIEVVYK